MDLLFGPGIKSTKNSGRGVLVVGWRVFVTALALKPFSSNSFRITSVGVVWWRPRITTRNALSWCS